MKKQVLGHSVQLARRIEDQTTINIYSNYLKIVM